MNAQQTEADTHLGGSVIGAIAVGLLGIVLLFGETPAAGLLIAAGGTAWAIYAGTKGDRNGQAIRDRIVATQAELKSVEQRITEQRRIVETS